MRSPSLLFHFAAAAVAFLLGADVAAQSSPNVLVVANSDSAASLEVATYYAQQRSIPSSQILKIPTSVTDEITRAVYVQQIERPIANWLGQNGAQDRIHFIVLTKGIPLRIQGTSGTQATTASVDSELTLLYRKLAGATIPEAGPFRNPYFAGETNPGAAFFTHKNHDVYLVTRLDGFTVSDVKKLIDRGLSPTTEPRPILLKTMDTTAGAVGDKWLYTAAMRVNETPGWDRQAVAATSAPKEAKTPVLGYFSWGSNDPASRVAPENVPFAPGAIGSTFVSTDARTFEPPPDSWLPGQPYKGSNQSLTGTLIRDGITAVAGNVFEPFLNAAVRPDVLFPAYIKGANIAEAFYMALPYLSWQSVVIGDPLVAPFRKGSVPADQLDPPIDKTTELPAFLSERRVANLSSSTVSPEAARQFVRADSRLRRSDVDGARLALETATRLSPQFAVAHLTLASIYEQTGRFDDAFERYLVLQKIQPDNPIVLNDLAFALAVRKNAPKEALPLATRAYKLAPNSPNISDTLGWIHHLLGDDKTAEPLVVAAVKGAPNNAEILLHAAIVFGANGKFREATQLLNRARSIDKTLDQRLEARTLQRQLETAK